MNTVIAGALFDFLAWLSTRDTLVVGAHHDAAPLPELLGEWADTRGLSLAGAEVQSWQKRLGEPLLAFDAKLPRRVKLAGVRNDGDRVEEHYLSATTIEGYLNDLKYGNDPAWLRANLRAELYR